MDSLPFRSEIKMEQAEAVTKKILIIRPGTINGALPRYDRRNTKLWRHLTQAFFMMVNLYVGICFYLWVRFFETGGTSPVPFIRPEGIEGWLPIAGLMNLKYTLIMQELPPVHAAAMFLLLAFLLVSLLLKKAFCSWLCPIGTLSEGLWKAGKHFFGKVLYLPAWLDIPLRGLKYLLLCFFLYISFMLSAEGIRAFLLTPYGLIIDVKLLDFFRHMGATTLLVLAVLTVLSLFIPNFWCRYLCPYGALIGLISTLSPYKIRRDPAACIDCAKCAKVCPARLPVDVKTQIRSAECTACMSCIEACPAKDALQFSLPPEEHPAANGDADNIARRWRGRKLSGFVTAAVIFTIVTGIIIMAQTAGVWQTAIPDAVYQTLIPKARAFSHP